MWIHRTLGFLLLAVIGLTGACGPAPTQRSPAPALSLPSELTDAASTNLPVLKAAQAVMVTVELDFGPNPPAIAEALQEIDRFSKPEDGTGRTFAIIDATGHTSPGNKLRISMHVSTEKPGIGALVFRRTGEILWHSRIVPADSPPAPKNLLIMVNNGQGRDYLLDGSPVKNSIMEAYVRDLATPLAQFWPDGEERQLTFIYSTCGCPVKVLCRRTGMSVFRTQELPVIFPDDPPVQTTIARLLGW